MAKPDLVKRLSDEPTSHELKRGLDAETTRIWHGLCLEARDEIEQLRKALGFYKSEVEALSRHLKNPESLALEATITVLGLDSGKRARAALEGK